MQALKIKNKLMRLYREVDEEMNNEIRTYGYVNLLTKGKKIGVSEAIFIVDSCLDNCDGWQF